MTKLEPMYRPFHLYKHTSKKKRGGQIDKDSTQMITNMRAHVHAENSAQNKLKIR
jgi:hypothetical protein